METETIFYQPPPQTLSKLQSEYKITSEVITEFLKSFNNFDKNGDGVISISELGQVIKLITPHLSHKPTESEIKEMIKAVDQNQDNLIQFHEFVALVVNKKDSVLQNSVQLNVGNNTLCLPVDGKFQNNSGATTIQTRSNSDSGISNANVSSNAVSSLDNTGNNSDNVNDAENNLDIEQVFKIFDKNGDGFISRTEISDVMFQLGEPVTADDISNMTLGKEHLNFDQFKQVITNHVPFPDIIKQEAPKRTDKRAEPPTSCSTCNIM